MSQGNGDERCECCVIGSGFGGSVTALRIAPRGRVVVLERGRRWDFADFRQSLDLSYFLQLYDFWAGPGVGIIGGRGVGGGSLVYSQVSLRAPSFVFDLDFGQGRLWPREYSRRALDPHYETVEAMLKVRQMAFNREDLPESERWRAVARRDHVFAKGLRRLGKPCDPMRLALSDCNDCGWCSLGCRFGKKQSLIANYIPQAEALGAEFRAQCDVDLVERLSDGSYRVHYRRSGQDNRAATLRAKVLVMAAGACGSAAILLRSKQAGLLPGLSEHVGKHLSLSGDLALGGVVPDVTDSWRGKIDASISYGFVDRGFILQSVHLPQVYAVIGAPFQAVPPSGRRYGREFAEYTRILHRHFLPVGVLGIDRSEGEVRVDRRGRASLRWNTHPQTMRMWRDAVKSVEELMEALGGHPIRHLFETHGMPGTVHPLGTARIADSPAMGAASPQGELWNLRNLFVVDGAAVPASILVNTSLTIAALAESLSGAIADRVGR